ncbi:MAG: PHP domain-containing protein, partial [Flavobacteriaceae bacterium]|nr:PHP domain-containing protein [Flavobacteriaceae bacterium]
MYLVFDTETTGLPKRWDAPITDTENWPRVVQIAWQLHDAMGECLDHQEYLIQPDGFNIPYDAEQVHGISTELAEEKGYPLGEVLEKFNKCLLQTKFLVGQNVGFDINVLGCEFFRIGLGTDLNDLPVLDTCTEHTASLCQLPGGRGGKFKLPTLSELYLHLFKESFVEAHNATADVEATARCFFELIRQREFDLEELQANPDYLEDFENYNPRTIELVGIKHISLKAASEEIRKKQDQKETGDDVDDSVMDLLNEAQFVHLHNHSQYSILQSTMSTADLVKAAAKYHMPAVALSDHANMMGAFHFVREVESFNRNLEKSNQDPSSENQTQPIKAIVGCEFYVCEDHSDKTRKDYGHQVVFLAKNKNGYHNLSKMSSLAYTDGFYYVPRIDKGIVQRYKNDLIVLTGNLYGEVPSKILNVGEKQAEEALLWWQSIFGDDLYIEVMRHGQEDERRANKVLVELARKHDVK